MQTQRTDSASVKEETRDECVLRLLALGDISVDEQGRVWKYGRRLGDTFSVYPEPRRIDLLTGCGYRSAKLTYQLRKRISVGAHRIQWIKHNGPIPKGKEINHKDMNKENNRIENLELVTREENHKHGRANHPTWRKALCGENGSKAKLTWEIVRFIRAEVGSGRATKAQMARKYNVTQVAIAYIMNGKNWKE